MDTAQNLTMKLKLKYHSSKFLFWGHQVHNIKRQVFFAIMRRCTLAKPLEAVVAIALFSKTA